ncbi:MAG: polysaccharide biosynthesis protein [Clostridia bacterium]|nr:polysaccharide biosynthesis protein [Clostridia bacterium]
MSKKIIEKSNLNSFDDASKRNHRFNVRWLLVFYDVCIYAVVSFLLLMVYEDVVVSTVGNSFQIAIIGFAAIFSMRFAFDIYRQIWRYGGIQTYIRLLICDGCGFALFFILELILPVEKVLVVKILAVSCINLLGALTLRMIYRYAYKCGTQNSIVGKTLFKILRFFGGKSLDIQAKTDVQLIKIAIVGAGRVGTGLAEDLINNKNASYVPRCFIDINEDKVGRKIHGITILSQEQATFKLLQDYGVQEIVFAVPQLDAEKRKELFDFYSQSGCKIKVYDYPLVENDNNKGKRHIREFDIEELLFRKQLDVLDEEVIEHYKDKRVLITGGGGSIGSELCRQIAKMGPEKLIILDVCENGAYEVQQELKMLYGNELEIAIEIVSVCNKVGLERVFKEHKPQIVLNAAAHKHVPLMEHNCIEAVENNVFGTLNTVELSEKYGVQRVIMVSTDKAVNPTNVMGATKRVCEMIVGAYSQKESATTYSATRFGNVLGSAGSVIPLFKKQIDRGGPITITDKRIVRYFMTIPEASQLVLKSGAMAENGELFVLDMGKPVKIIELAENMIRLSGMEPYNDIEIIETGLRPGEKLYEETLVNSDLEKTESSSIFIEREKPHSINEINAKLSILRTAVETGDDNAVKEALKVVVETYKSPEEVNKNASEAKEMKNALMV